VTDVLAAAVDTDGPPLIGLAALARMVFAGGELQSIADRLVERANAGDMPALMDLATLLLLTGDRDNGLRLQSQALASRRLYRRPAARPGGLKLLALMATGDTMANTPLDFLLEGSDVELLQIYVDADNAPPQPVPDHDVAFLAIGESEANRRALQSLEPILAHWPRPVLNGAAGTIAGLTRDGVCARLAGLPGVLAPSAIRAERTALAMGEIPSPFPVLVRPVGSQAGAGLAKLEGPDDVAVYLAGQIAERFYISPFIDYAGPDGLYRKQRIALIEGRPFVCHLAVSPRWMVHYMNADMADNAAHRAEEARFMARFDEDFAVRHAQAFAGLADRIGLDYFAIDCAETRDGRLLLFEADVAMIVHAMDPPDLYPYKAPQMRKVFAAFQAMLRRSALKSVPSG
jgi:hypothetical protein